MPSARIEIDFDEIGRLLRAEGEYGSVRADLTRRMERVLQAAIATSPVRSGEHRASLHIEQHDGDSRAVVRVIADSDHSIGVEADTGHIARALDAAGGS